MSEPQDLATLLDNAQSPPSQPIETKAEASPAPEAVEVNAQTGEKQDAAPPAESIEGEDGSGRVPIKVVHEERRKRQELERQLAELTKQRTAPPAQQQAQPQAQHPQAPMPDLPERPDPWIDPEGAMAWDRAAMQQQIQTQVFETRTVLSREMMMSSKPDFQEVEAIFIEAARRAPHLVEALKAHPMPAKYAYETGLKIKAWNEIGDDPAAYKQRVREELEAERGQQQAAPSQPQTPKGSTPKSLAATPSAQPRDQHGRFQGPASLESILGG
jgi:hypothetical protein